MILRHQNVEKPVLELLNFLQRLDLAFKELALLLGSLERAQVLLQFRFFFSVAFLESAVVLFIVLQLDRHVLRPRDAHAQQFPQPHLRRGTRLQLDLLDFLHRRLRVLEQFLQIDEGRVALQSIELFFDFFEFLVKLLFLLFQVLDDLVFLGLLLGRRQFIDQLFELVCLGRSVCKKYSCIWLLGSSRA